MVCLWQGWLENVARGRETQLGLIGVPRESRPDSRLSTAASPIVNAFPASTRPSARPVPHEVPEVFSHSLTQGECACRVSLFSNLDFL